MPSHATILIVDDDAVARKLVSAHLESEGYTLATAESGKEALAMAARLKPDLVLLDVMMPEINGFEVCRRLRADPALSEVPVIMITALDDSRSKIDGIEAGADDFLSKPYDTTELRARVRTITRLDRYRRLQAERAKFEWVVERSDDGYLLLHKESDEVLYANPKARAFLEIEGDLPKDPFLLLATARYRVEPRHLWKDWPAPKNTPLFLLHPESPSTDALWLRVDLLDQPSEHSAVLVRLRDQTSKMALGRNLYQFGSLVSEKLKTPLRMTLESLDMMVRQSERFSKDEIERLSRLALRSGHRLERQLKDILTLLDQPDRAQWESGFELAQLETLTSDLASAMRLSPLEVRRGNLSQGRLPLSPVAMELILREIFDNAQQFHPTSSPRLGLRLDVDEAGVRRKARLTLTNDDSTASADQLHQFWIPYYQNVEDSTIDAAGMGFGSSMVGALIWGVGGTCRISDREEAGVEVELVLPLVEAAASSP